jgi:hypothetical protein
VCSSNAINDWFGRPFYRTVNPAFLLAKGVGSPPCVSGPLGLGGATNPLVPRRGLGGNDRPAVRVPSRASATPSAGVGRPQESAAGLNPRDRKADAPCTFGDNSDPPSRTTD